MHRLPCKIRFPVQRHLYVLVIWSVFLLFLLQENPSPLDCRWGEARIIGCVSWTPRLSSSSKKMRYFSYFTLLFGLLSWRFYDCFQFAKCSQDESMHSGADVEAFQAALNRDIEGDASTSQPSDVNSGVNSTSQPSDTNAGMSFNHNWPSTWYFSLLCYAWGF